MAELKMDAFSIDESALEVGDLIVPTAEDGNINDDVPDSKIDDDTSKVKDPTIDDIAKDKDDDIPIVDDDNNKKDIDNVEGGDATSTDSSPNNPYSSFAKTLAGSLPYLDLEDKKITSAEDLLKVYEESIEEEVKTRQFLELNDNQKYYLEALKSGVPEQDVQENISFEDSINNITKEDIESDPELRKGIIKQAFLVRGFNEAEANKQVDRSISVGEDIEDAVAYQGSLSKYVADKKEAELTKVRTQQAAHRKKLDEDLVILKSTIDKPEEILPGTNMSPKFKTELYDMITKPAGQVEGRDVNWLAKFLNEDPVNNQLKLAYMFKVTDGFKNIDKASGKKARSKAVKDLDQVLNSTKFDDTGVYNPKTTDDNESFSLGTIDGEAL